MRAFLQFVMAMVIVICMGIGLYFIYQSLDKKPKPSVATAIDKDDTPQAAQVRQFLTKFPKPQRIEVETLTERLKDQVDGIKKMKMPLDQNSQIYVRIQFFTDENDSKSKLIAQFRIFDLKSDNLLREESINLD